MNAVVLDDYRALLRITPDMLAAIGMEPETAKKIFVELLHHDAEAGNEFARACQFESPYGESWIHQAYGERPYLSLDLAHELFEPSRLRSLLAGIVLSDSVMIPYDYRAFAAEQLAALGPGQYLPDLQRVAEETQPLPVRSLATKIRTRSDGIDHLFDIPESVDGRLRLLMDASAAKTRETQAVLARRIIHGPDASSAGPAPEEALRGALVSPEVDQFVTEDVGTSFILPADYLMVWDQELAEPAPGSEPLTLAEILRICLMSPEFKLPDIRVRPVLLGFYRSALRISGRSIIGLSGGVFYVEHGADASPSYFYMGRDAVIGKGCTIDCVGGAVLQQGSFLGGGFMPILIHTHKHIRNAGEPGIAERKRVQPAVFMAMAGARLPMAAIGIFETADFTQAETPYEGIRAIAPIKQGEQR